MLRNFMIAAFSALASASLLADDAPFFKPAPGHEGVPVVFWGHYMPQLGTAQIDQNGHGQGGNDCFPFLTCDNSPEEQHIRYALDAGVNGFQMLTFPAPKMYEAARSVYAKTGKMFYVNPLWCDAGNSEESFNAAIDMISKFATEHKNDPHVFSIDGKQVHFLWHSLGCKVYFKEKLSDEDLGDSLVKAKELLKAKGVEVLFIPACAPSDKLALDRTDMGYGKWPAFKKPEPGPMKCLSEAKWDGLDSWSTSSYTPSMADMVLERLKQSPNKKFIFMPPVWPGYDSSNRVFQATHCQSYGIRVLRDYLKIWVERGFRQLALITWNDVDETMLLPSTRSPFGFSEAIRYYQQLAIDGSSPFDAPKTVVAYDPETLYGDELYFQFLHLPEKDALSSDYICQVRLENLDGSEAACLTSRASVPDERHDAIAEVRMDTTGLIGKAEVLSPVVSVTKATRYGNERQIVFKDLRLPPITLRHNKIQFYSSYAIALDRIAPDTSISLEAPKARNGLAKAATGDFVPLTATVEGKEKLRRLTLAESRMTRGAFRADDSASSVASAGLKSFLRIRCEENIDFKLSLSRGKALERFAWSGDKDKAVQRIDAPSCESQSKLLFGAQNSKKKSNDIYSGMSNAISRPVFRIEAPLDAKVTVSAKSDGETLAECTLKDLAASPLTANGSKGCVRLELALDAIEYNQDYPLPEAGAYVRGVPMDAFDDASRYFHAWALTESDKVAYSRPLEIVKTPKQAKGFVVKSPDEPVPCQLIRTRGVFDDFVDSSSSVSVNPFTQADIVAAVLPARQIPYYLYDFEEGAGTMLNDGGTAHQCGRAWLSAEGCEWLKDGWRGSAIRLKGGSIEMRSKSWPHGAYTFSARIKTGTKPSAAPLAGDGDYWLDMVMQGLRIDILKDGRVKAVRQIRDCEGEAVSSGKLPEGWSHLAVTHDLRSLRIYINGKLAGEGPVSKPGYARTHSRPTIGFSRVEKALKGKDEPAALFTGELDQIEVIGAALSPESIASLCEKGQWMAR